MLDILDYSHLISNQSFILFLDFYKAFDTLEHNFVFLSLKRFGFGSFFSVIQLELYIVMLTAQLN